MPAPRLVVGAEVLLMLPYLSGERAPRWAGDPHGAFLGLTQRHTRAHLARSVDDAAAMGSVTEVVHSDRDAARFYRRLLPAFARTAEAVEDLDAWRIDGSADAAAAVLARQASKEEMP